MFEKLVFDNHQQFARFADYMNENYKKFEEQWACKVEVLNERIQILSSSQENLMKSIDYKFGSLEEYIKNLTFYFDNLEKSIKKIESEVWIDIRNIREEWCEKNRDRITEIEKDLDDYKRISSRIISLEKFYFENFVLKRDLSEKFDSFEDRMTDRFCKVAEMINTSENKLVETLKNEQTTKICELYCCINASISHDNFFGLLKALIVCFPNIKFNEIPNEFRLRICKSMYPDSPLYK
jgi:hypothetical protein